MVRINKNTLPKKKVEQLHQHLHKVIGELKPDQIDEFLGTLLGPEERLMVAKRLAVVVMLKEEYSDYRIAETLKLSPSTIRNIRTRHGKGSFTEATKALSEHKETYMAILEIIDSLLLGGGIMPRRTGLDRYRNL